MFSTRVEQQTVFMFVRTVRTSHLLPRVIVALWLEMLGDFVRRFRSKATTASHDFARGSSLKQGVMYRI